MKTKMVYEAPEMESVNLFFGESTLSTLSEGHGYASGTKMNDGGDLDGWE